MPIYTYKCNNCDFQFEQRQRMSDAPLSECPVCAGNVRRMVNSVGIVFKGSGFYVTDNRNGSKNGTGATTSSTTEGKEVKKDKKSSEAKNEAKSESKSEKTAEAKAV